ncbi:MAG TPA: hypothetical protein VM121_08305 [Acidimicrobiales bacterium]|nr:hypothetical protein [Acidimicrobiales bacterium]
MESADVRDRDNAVIGWRYWQVASGTGHLRSVTQKRVEWPPGHVLVARCSGAGHRAPERSCECGIYGARDLSTLREHGLCLAPEVLIVGEVALWGTVIDDPGPDRPSERGICGWRGEFAVPAALQVVDDLVPGLDTGDLARSLERSYRIPVATMALTDAVAGASATILTFQAMAARASRSSARDD